MRQKTVLLVEDNDDNRFIFTTILENSGFRVLQAKTGEEGVAIAREQRPDAVLMDISLPVMDGLEATHALKSESATRAIPIIAVTAHDMDEDRGRARSAGCDGYLVKPIEPKLVVVEVERLIGPAREE